MPAGFERIVERLSDGEVLPIEVEFLGRNGSPANYHSYAHAFAGMLCMFLLFAGQTAARRLVEEREAGTLHRLRLSAIRPHTVLVGVGVASAIIALLASALAYAVGVLAFDIPVHDPIGFGAVLLGQAICVGGFALLLAGFGRTGRQVDGIGTFAVLVMSFVGGAWLPSFLMPDWLRTIAAGMPTHWTTEGLAAMTWRGDALSMGLMYAGVLAGFGLIFALIGMWRFRFE
jgi:ABC-2 type transport system permease protein